MAYRPATSVLLRGLVIGVHCLVARGDGGCSRSTPTAPDGGPRVLPAVYPPPDVRKNLYLPEEVTADYERLRTRV